MPFLDDLVFLMEDQNVAQAGVNLWYSTRATIPKLPSGQASLVMTETGGAGPEMTHNLVVRPAYLNPSAQLVARAETYAAARSMAQAAWDACFAVRNQYIGSGDTLPWYLWIRPLQEPTDFGVDPAGSIRVGFNVTARMRP